MEPYPTSFQPPEFLQDFPVAEALPAVFLVVFVIWAIYSAISAYHWIRFGHESWAAVPALLVHATVSGWVMLYAVSGIM